MNRSYEDILSRISEKPSWWQEGGVPRYETFSPRSSTGVYANEVALLEIACQGCQHPFVVAVETAATDRRLAQEIRERNLGYGDPPSHDCGGAGLAMSSITVRVLEYWAKADRKYLKDNVVVDYRRYFEWRRDSTLEIVFPPFWVTRASPTELN